MEEKDFSNIEAPKKGEITPKRKRVYTGIFTMINCIFNLVFAVAFTFILILFLSWLIHAMNANITQEEFSKYVKPIMWGSVIAAVAGTFALQKLITRAIIKGFKMQNKLEASFVERYCGTKK